MPFAVHGAKQGTGHGMASVSAASYDGSHGLAGYAQDDGRIQPSHEASESVRAAHKREAMRMLRAARGEGRGTHGRNAGWAHDSLVSGSVR